MKRAGYTVTEAAPDVFFVEGPASNWTILRRGERFTLVDGGYPGDLPLVRESIRDAGLDPADGDAVLVTHAHVDHAGTAAHFARQYCTPVFSSAAEHRQLVGVEKIQVSSGQVLVRAWKPRVLRWSTRALRAGGRTPVSVLTAEVWDDALLASLPGGPVAVPTPGHTPGHTSFYLPAAKAVITGDALVTGHAISTRNGPQSLHPMFQHDGVRADSALAELAGLDASLILPGHGPALKMGIVEAVDVVRRRAGTRTS